MSDARAPRSSSSRRRHRASLLKGGAEASSVIFLRLRAVAVQVRSGRGLKLRPPTSPWREIEEAGSLLLLLTGCARSSKGAGMPPPMGCDVTGAAH
ncbi:hypothetical protein OAN61_00990 [bacterium]|nr:hypothetical protein [bacterium]